MGKKYKSHVESKTIFETILSFLMKEGEKMSEKMDREHIGELKRMIQEKKPTEPVEKILVKFCARHGVSLDICRVHYNRLVEEGEIKEK